MGILVDCRSLPESGRFTSELRSSSPQSPAHQYFSVFQCLMCWGNGNLVSVNVVVDPDRSLWNSLTASKQLWQKIPGKHIFDICGKKRYMKF